MVEGVLFVLMAITALAGAVTVVVARNPVYSAMGLLGTLFSVAVLYVAQLAHFVAAVQVIVYAPPAAWPGWIGCWPTLPIL